MDRRRQVKNRLMDRRRQVKNRLMDHLRQRNRVEPKLLEFLRTLVLLI